MLQLFRRPFSPFPSPPQPHTQTPLSGVTANSTRAIRAQATMQAKVLTGTALVLVSPLPNVHARKAIHIKSHLSVFS